MAVRRIIRIDEERCNGCGRCVEACVEGAIRLVDGKARLVSESYCDGLGACIGECPQGAITVEEREAPPFDERAALAAKAARTAEPSPPPSLPCGCPGSASRTLRAASPGSCRADAPSGRAVSELVNWPVQLRLVPVSAPYLEGADLLLAADCVPFACADFHALFLRGRPVLVGCPKLDDARYYVGKLAEILAQARPRSLTVVRMEVPCCGGLVRIAREAVAASGAGLGVAEVVVGVDGSVQAPAGASTPTKA